jgi:hypothetical protein
MMNVFRFAVVAAILSSPLASAAGAHALPSLKYEEAAWLCSTGDLQACEVMYVYDMARSNGAPGGKSGHE